MSSSRRIIFADERYEEAVPASPVWTTLGCLVASLVPFYGAFTIASQQSVQLYNRRSTFHVNGAPAVWIAFAIGLVGLCFVIHGISRLARDTRKGDLATLICMTLAMVSFLGALAADIVNSFRPGSPPGKAPINKTQPVVAPSSPGWHPAWTAQWEQRRGVTR